MGRRTVVSIIGCGVVGQATGKGLARIGHQTIFFDVDKNKLDSLSSEGYEVSRTIVDAVSSSSLSFVCIQTPTIEGSSDLTFLRKAMVSVSKAVKEKRADHLSVVRSTILPGTMKKEIAPIVREYCSGETCYNPEFLREEHALEDFMNPSRIVIGEEKPENGAILAKVYRPLNAPIIRTNFQTAEMIKYVSNAFLGTKISFFNEIFLVCKKLERERALEIDPQIVSEAVSLDPRIGKYGIYGGKPFSGGCLPKDLKAFATFIHGLGINPDLLERVLDINSKISRQSNGTVRRR